MKKLSIALMVLVLISGFTFFFNTAIAVPPMPNDVNMIEPDPALSPELKAFWGKWQGSASVMGGIVDFFCIVEKIDEKEATLYLCPVFPSYGWRELRQR